MTPRPVRAALLAAMLVMTQPYLHAEDGPLPVADLKRETPVDFYSEVLPFLRKNCLACHNETKAKADLVLENPETILKGGDTGPAVEPGKADNSLLFTTSAHIEEPTMPPTNNKSKAENLSPAQLALLKLWIDQGAKGGNRLAMPAPEVWRKLDGFREIYSLAVSPDGRFAACGRGHQIHLYDLRLNQFVGSLTDPELKDASHRDLVQSLAFGPDGTLASGGFRVVKFWKRPPVIPVSVVKPEAAPAGPLKVESPDGKWHAEAAADGCIRVTELAAAKPAPAPAPATPAPATPAPATPAPAPATPAPTKAPAATPEVPKEDAAPAAEKPAPVAEKPAPAAEKPAPAAEKPAPVAEKPAPVAEKPAPVAEKPAPTPAAAEKPAPATPEKAAPVAEKPAPAPAAPAVVELKGHTGKLTFLVALNAGRILSAGEDGTIRIWDVAGKKQALQIAAGGPVKALALHPDKSRLVASTGKGTATIYQLSDGKPGTVLSPEPALDTELEEITAQLAMAKRLSDLYGKEIPTLEEALKKEQEAADTAGMEIPAAELARKEKLAARDTKTRALELAYAAVKRQEGVDQKALDAAGTVVTNLLPQLEAAEAELAAADRAIVLARRNRVLGVRLTGAAAEKLAEAKALKVTADATTEAITARKTALEKRKAEEWPKVELAGVAWAPDGTRIALARKDGTVLIYSADGVFLEPMVAGGELAGVRFGEDGRLVTMGPDGQHTTWSTDRKWELASAIGDGKDSEILIDRVTALSFSPQGDRLVTGSGVPSRSGWLKIWNPQTGALIAENQEAHSDTITDIAFSPEGDRIATGSTDKFMKTFDAETAEERQSFEAHTGHVLGVAWSADGRLLASSSADTEVKVWSLKTGEQEKTLKGWGKEVTSVSFLSGASDALVITSGDETLKIDATPLAGSSGFLYQARVTPDGKLILAGGEDGVLRVWTAADRKLVQSFEPPAGAVTAGE